MSDATAKNLLGIWSNSAMCGAGAQSDEVLVFKQDGTGFLEVQKPVTILGEWFTWSLASLGVLRLTGTQKLTLNAECTALEQEKSDLNVVVPFSIQPEDTKAGRRMRVLRFASRPWPDFPDQYAFCRRDVIGYEEPNFSWVQRLKAR